MEIEKARVLGFCFGVRRAVKLIEKAAGEGHGVETLGAVVHNKAVTDRLQRKGARVIGNLSEAAGPVVAISSHGAGPETSRQIHALNMRIVDATCPSVRSAQRVAEELSGAGFRVVVFGDAGHPEVKGIIGWTAGNGSASLDAAEILAAARPENLAIISQTTQNPADFADFVSLITQKWLAGCREIRVVNTICKATMRRQSAAAELAAKTDVMIVVGGRASSNTKRLAEVCRNAGVDTHLVETAEDIDPAWLKGRRRAGVTAGTSTPEEDIEAVMERLRRLSGA